MSTQQIFAIWADAFETSPKTWARFAGRYKWTVRGSSGGVCVLDCGIRPQVLHGDTDPVDFEIVLSEPDLFELVRGELNPQLAFLERRFQVIGKTKHVLRFNFLLESLLQLTADHSESLAQHS
ncbi:MAG: SCP2 sterol-binding domain-containing protein [Bdellovibrionota bacterium]